MSESKTSAQKSAELVQKVEKTGKNIIELSSGIVLNIKDEINPAVLIDILADLENNRPEVPIVYIEALDREEENPDDPGYIDLYNRWETVSASRIADALILIGTTIGSIPKGIEGPEGNDWIATLEVLGFKFNRRSKPARYLAWVKHVGIKNVDDWSLITEKVGRLAGVSEADVQLAQSSFPGEEG